MPAVWNFLVGWKDLIVEVFKQYPLAAALALAAAVGLFVLLQRERNIRNDQAASIIHGGAALLAWLIAVPVLGFILRVLGIGYAFGVGAIEFAYTRYEQQPIYCLICVALAVVAFFIWPYIRPATRAVRLALTAIALIFLIAVGVPLLNATVGTAVAASDQRTKASAIGK